MYGNHRTQHSTWCGVKALLVVALTLPSLATAAIYPCSEAGLTAGLAAGGLVQFACPGPATIPITSTKTVGVSGTVVDGQDRVTFQGSPGFSLFAVTTGVTATFHNLTITGASTVALGAVISCNSATTCSFDQVTLSANNAGAGGSILYSNGGSLSVSNSTISGSTGTAVLGDSASISLSNSTVIGARNAVLARNGTTASVRHSTLVSLNTAVQAVGPTDAVSVGHVLFSNNAVGVSGSGVTSVGYNVVEDALPGAQPTDIVGVPARVLALASNGGPTQTVALQSCSPAIDAGSSTATLPFDQRGNGFPRVRQLRQDIGAFESNLTAIPCIATQPTGQTVFATQTLRLSVGAITGLGTLSYQWRRNGTPITGATSATYTKTAVLADAGSYDVVVTNPAGSVTSNAVTVTVNGPPAITTQPQGQALFAGQSLDLFVTALGQGLTYQWRKNGAPLTGATGDTYTLSVTTTADSGNYDVKVTNPSGSVTSDVAMVVVQGPPSITVQPVAVDVFEGQPFTLTVEAMGESLEYQWQHDGAVISDATQASFTRTMAALGDGGDYEVVVTNPAGNVTSQRVRVTVKGPPVLTDEPLAMSLFVGQPLMLSVAATGDALSYQWRRDGAPLAQATGATLSISAVTLQDSGAYDCVVTNGAGSVTSATATVTVKGPPVVTRHPMSVDVAEGAALTLIVEATGDALTYQWRRGGVELAHATSATYSVAMATVEDSGDYDVVVTNPAGSVTSEKATVRVLPESNGPVAGDSGCGCNSGAGNLLSVLALIGLALRRRRLVRSS